MAVRASLAVLLAVATAAAAGDESAVEAVTTEHKATAALRSPYGEPTVLQTDSSDELSVTLDVASGSQSLGDGLHHALAAPVQLFSFSDYIDFWKGWAWLIKFLGRLLLVLPCLGAFSNFSQHPESFINIMENYHLPAPKIWAYSGLAFLIVGSLLVISGDSLLVVIGAKLLVIFLLFATYFGHYKPMKQSMGEPKINHLLHTLKNFAIVGGLLCLVGYEIVNI